MWKTITTLFCSIFFFACNSHATPPAAPPINQDNAKAAKAETEVIGLDVRTKEEFARNGSKRAKHIPVAELGQRLKELDKNKKILVYCESGARASRAVGVLKGAGFKNVQNIGTWREWNKLK